MIRKSGNLIYAFSGSVEVSIGLLRTACGRAGVKASKMKNFKAVNRGLLLALSAGSVTLASLASSATISACGGDDDFVPPPDAAVDSSTDVGDGSTDAAVDHSSPGDAMADHAVLDAGVDADSAPADAAAATHVLVVSGSTSSTLSSYSLASGSLEGTTAFTGGFGAPTNAGTAPFLLEQAASVVARLDVASPWKIDSSWNVLGTDTPTGAATYTDPYAVVVSAGTKAYVLRYTRNVIDVIDTSQTADGGAPSGSVDLTALVQAGDNDGLVDMTNAFYDATTKRLWVVLENIDNTTYPLACRSTVGTVVAIDTASDTLVSLGGSGPGGAYAFALVDPSGVVFDSANDRIIAAAYGCQAEEPLDAGDGGDAGAAPGGPIVGAGIEAISLKDGAHQVLFTAAAIQGGGRGSALALVGGNTAVATFLDPDTFASTGYVLDLTGNTVKSTLTLTPGSFTTDGNGHLYGTAPAADGGTATDVVEVTVADGSSKVVAAGVVTDPSVYVGGVALW